MTDGNIAAVKKAVEDDAHCTVEEISSLCGINSSLFFQNIDSRVKGTQGLRQVDTPLSH